MHDVSEEVSALWQQAGVTLQGARPWTEFFEVFKPPLKTDLERRMSTNLLHYRANYCQIVCVLMGFAVVASPRALLAVLMSLASAFAIFLFKRTSLAIGDMVVPLTKRTRAAAAGIASALMLALSGALLWLLLMFALALFLVLSHMALRPRTLAAKYNAAADDVRGMFFGGDNTARGGDYEDGLFHSADTLHSRARTNLHFDDGD
ncbi:hypothetical protein CTAYLR_004071 [Chrysophaeum taylorii]|uniref:PRA1 family protein n=1 Tax=Chrysophaeum taylorii TaxID=2483200 RepID=A0AAD7U732_9STRA|nr:hypothetical protein CTAYLR_010487 [Chrysophaeum taylorii]KAJ8613019.1 hypothetical protein CTAYLR_004071 [Chrysophaeum taylorii]